MSEDRLNSLLTVWQEQQCQGRDLSAAELCRDCPELAEPLGQRIQVLRFDPRIAQFRQDPRA